MRRVLCGWLILMALVACEKEKSEENVTDEIFHEMIVLGEQLEDPYSVDNINRAIQEVYPTKGERHDVTATDLYVRFLPKDEHELEVLTDSGLDLMDHPLDFQIRREGDYYHDPSLDEDKITWQYTVVNKDFKFPYQIHYEILDDCFIPEHDARTKSDGMDWEMIVRESYRLTGNENALQPQVRSNSALPSGRITIEDEQFAGGKPIGVAGVKVVCNSFVKFSSCYTDQDGFYQIPCKYSSKVRYRLMFQNQKGFSIGLNWILVPASMSALGKGGPEGKSVHIDRGSDRNLYCRSVVNNAVYDYSDRMQSLGIHSFPDHLRIWLLQKISNSSAVMLRHGTVLNYSFLQRYLGEYIGLVKLFLPDLTLGLKDCMSYKEIYQTAIHECAHASHFNQVGVGYWNHYINYILKSFFRTGSIYGDGSEDNAGYCAVGEMWACAVEHTVSLERYGASEAENVQYDWFYPQILFYLNDRGISVEDIFQVLSSEVCSVELLKEALVNQYPEKELTIYQAFDKYIY